jgi:hypothetical protein
MMSTVNKFNWNGFYRNIFYWWNKRRNDELTKVDRAGERSIIILQKRYGYTKEEAAYQLNKHYSRAFLG